MNLWLGTELQWQPALLDPSNRRAEKPRNAGRTMVIDKGLGLHAFEDLLSACGDYIDVIKLGFGTAALYPTAILQRKIKLALAKQVDIMPGGTFLEAAVRKGVADDYFYTAAEFGFNCVEISDGTIEMDRAQRNQFISMALHHHLKVYTEYGKKAYGSTFELDDLYTTVNEDLACGASAVIVEGREAGAGVGIFDKNGQCHAAEVMRIQQRLGDLSPFLMWETPQKSQQVFFLQTIGQEVNLGNILPEDVMSVETLRRGLRSDTLLLFE